MKPGVGKWTPPTPCERIKRRANRWIDLGAQWLMIQALRSMVRQQDEARKADLLMIQWLRAVAVEEARKAQDPK